MERYEYTVIPAPDRGQRNKSAKTPSDRYALALGEVLNDMASHGWDYVRAETLPSEERSGIASRQTLWHNLLIFRRSLGVEETVTVPPATGPAPDPEPKAEPAKPATPIAPVETAQTAPPVPPPAPKAEEKAETKPAPKPESATADHPPLRKKAEVESSPFSGPRLGPAAR